MKKSVMFVILVIILISFVSAQPPTPFKPDYAGVWSIWTGAHSSATDNPWLNGAHVTIPWGKWGNLEPTNNNFNYYQLDKGINNAVNNGYENIMVTVYVGHDSPEWIYDPISEGGGGVPKVITDTSHSYGNEYPYYIHDNYKTLVKRMITKVKERIESYPPNVRNRIIGIEGLVGRSNDWEGYQGEPLDSQYDISDAEWFEYQKEMFQYYLDTYQFTNPKIEVMFSIGGQGYYARQIDQWLRDNTHSWLLFHWPGHCYQYNQDNAARVMPNSKEYLPNGWAMIARDEFDNILGNRNPGIFTEAPLWYVYWTGLHSLYNGLDIWNIAEVSKVNGSEFHPIYDFFNEYAGYHDAAEAHGAFIALRDGLDENDLSRFPESTYGTHYKWWQQNLPENIDVAAQRYINIANAFSQYGAWQDPNYKDAPHRWFYIGSCEMPHQNDVGHGDWAGNFNMYIDQINPLGTSQGYWRVGSTNQMYGRFARGFEHSKGLDTMYFNISDRFFLDQPLNGDYPIDVTVTYFDSGFGTWGLKYDAVGNPSKIAYSLTKTNSGLWKKKTVRITDAFFGNRGQLGSDFMLENTDTENDIFHMIEIERVYGSPGLTCQDVGNCCDSCASGALPSYDSDCSGQVCCDVCSLPQLGANYTVKWTNTPPSIDGNLGEYSGIAPITLTASTGTSGSYWFMWDEDYLYTGAQLFDSKLNVNMSHVNDDNIWEQDSYEFMFDTLHDKSSTLQTDDYKFYISPNSVHQDTQRFDSSWDSGIIYQVLASGTINNNLDIDTGYIIEAKIPWTTWVKPLANDVWGMNIQINDMTDTGKYTKQWSEAGLGSNSPLGWNEINFIGPSCSSNADTNYNDIVEISELLTFISNWKSGSVSIGDLLSAISEWKNGC